MRTTCVSACAGMGRKRGGRGSRASMSRTGQSSAACHPNPNCHQSTRAHVQLRKTYCHRVPIRHQVTKPHRKGTGIQCCTNPRAKRSWLLDRHDITVVSARAYPLDGKHVRDPVWKLQTRMLVNLARCEFRPPFVCMHTYIIIPRALKVSEPWHIDVEYTWDVLK